MHKSASQEIHNCFNTVMEKKICAHTHTHTHASTEGARPRKDVFFHIYVSFRLTKGSICTPSSNAKSHNGISDGKNVLSSDDGQIEGEYSQMSKMINGRVQRQDHTHKLDTGRQDTEKYSLPHS